MHNLSMMALLTRNFAYCVAILTTAKSTVASSHETSIAIC